VPRFFFDTHNGDQFIPDEAGQEMQCSEAAKAVAQTALADMARDALPDKDQRTFIVSVRDEAGQVVVRTALSLLSEYPSEAPK
jgi:hypothetical protein